MISGLEQITDSVQLTSENARLFLSPAGLLQITWNGETQRAFLALAFPFETEEEYVSVLNEEKEEIGMIRTIYDFDEETVRILKGELKKKYFTPKIRKIKKLTERHGGSFWECDTDFGSLSFAVRDTHRSLLRAGADRIFVLDHDGCRYEIESVSGLDKKSYSKIELYL